MNITLINNDGRYKMITYRNKFHTVLRGLAEIYKTKNKIEQNKVGIYSVYKARNLKHVWVFSYISEKTEKMTKKQYKEFLKGKRQMRQKPWSKILEPNAKEKQELLEVKEMFM